MRTSAGLIGVIAVVLSACSGESAGGDGGGNGGISGPATWSALYADYFAPTSAAGCGGTNAACHSSPDAPGTVVSKLICTDQEECRTSLMGTSGLIRPQDVYDPSGAPLFKYLRTPGGAGKMPKDSTFVFYDEDIARIEDWIANGAKDD